MPQDSTTHQPPAPIGITVAVAGDDPEITTAIACAVRRLVQQFGLPEQDRDDLTQELWVVVLEALPRFDPARAKRSTFIDSCIGKRVYNLLRDRRRQMRDPRRVQAIESHVDAASADAVPATIIAAAGAAVDRQLADSDLRLDVAAMTASLPAQQQALCALLALGTAPHAIANRLGCSRRQVAAGIAQVRAACCAAGLAPGQSTAAAVEEIGGLASCTRGAAGTPATTCRDHRMAAACSACSADPATHVVHHQRAGAALPNGVRS